MPSLDLWFFSAAVEPVLWSVLADICTQYDSGAELFAYLDDGYLWIKPKYLLQTIAAITTATRSVNLALQSTKTQVWRASCQDPIPPEFQDKVTHTLSCFLEDIFKSMEALAGHHGENNTTLSENCHHTC